MALKYFPYSEYKELPKMWMLGFPAYSQKKDKEMRVTNAI